MSWCIQPKHRRLVLTGVSLLLTFVAGTLFVAFRPPPPPLSLTVQLHKGSGAADAIEFTMGLHNTSTRTQTVFRPSTNFFWGNVYCRDTNGTVREYFHTNTFGLIITVLVIEPIELAPGASRYWRHSLSDFVRFTPGGLRTDGSVDPGTFHSLVSTFQPGCDLWCSFYTSTNEALLTQRISYPQKLPANKIGRANRRPTFPFNAGQQSGTASCAPPFLSAAVAHLCR